MRIRPRRSSKGFLLILGAAALIPLIATPASAGRDGGGFFIHAFDDELPEISATAGLNLEARASAPGDTDNSAVLNRYSCGPMDLKITQAMVDFSKANEELRASGRANEIREHETGGWQTISHYSTAAGGFIEGFPTDGSKPIYAFLGAGNPNDSASLRAVASDFATQCSVSDLRAIPKAGSLISYSWYKDSGTYSETRYLEQDGELVSTAVAFQGHDGALSVSRAISPISSDPAVSDRIPSSLRLGSDGAIRIDAKLRSATDGYNYVSIDKLPDGSGSMSYSFYRGSNDSSHPARKHGPTMVFWDSSGEISSLQYFDSAGTMQSVYSNGDPETLVDRYNQQSGQDWDGSFHRVEDFDIGLPFQPTEPQ